ncbi:hypothetical protein AB1N83_011371, partial [Pleurotus pulmonarius]
YVWSGTRKSRKPTTQAGLPLQAIISNSAPQSSWR